MLRKRLLLITAAIGTALAADAPSLAGKWQVHINVGGTERDQSCTFTQKDADLTGTCNTDGGAVEITGKVDEKKVAWTYKSDYNGSPLTVAFSGTLESPSKITGTVNVAEFSVDGDFTATQSK